MLDIGTLKWEKAQDYSILGSVSSYLNKKPVLGLWTMSWDLFNEPNVKEFRTTSCHWFDCSWKHTAPLASNSLVMMTAMMSLRVQASTSELSSILLHQSCIMSMCFKWCSTVELIGADSCIKSRVCVSVDIRYAFYGQPAYLWMYVIFIASYFLPLCCDMHIDFPLFTPGPWLFCQCWGRKWEWLLGSFIYPPPSPIPCCFGCMHFLLTQWADWWSTVLLALLKFTTVRFFSSVWCFIKPC